MPRSRPAPEPPPRLLRQARAAMKNAYAPYSKFHVGAALLLADGRVFSGCNVENASYGLTICAERNAIFAAVAAGKRKPEIATIVVANDRGIACSPCGACRQVIAEFGAQTAVWFWGQDGWTVQTIGQLLPNGFVFD
jgi:cytidine deaminase